MYLMLKWESDEEKNKTVENKEEKKKIEEWLLRKELSLSENHKSI